MTVKELSEKMDAVELMEWLAYFKLKDKEEFDRLHLEIEKTKSDEYHANKLRDFLIALSPMATTNDTSK
jgi:hypothetical protein